MREEIKKVWTGTGKLILRILCATAITVATLGAVGLLRFMTKDSAYETIRMLGDFIWSTVAFGSILMFGIWCLWQYFRFATRHR